MAFFVLADYVECVPTRRISRARLSIEVGRVEVLDKPALPVVSGADIGEAARERLLLPTRARYLTEVDHERDGAFVTRLVASRDQFFDLPLRRFAALGAQGQMPFPRRHLFRFPAAALGRRLLCYVERPFNGNVSLKKPETQ